jgi:hypothetical protein
VHDARPQHVRERRQRHGGARVPVAAFCTASIARPAHHVDAAPLDLRPFHCTPFLADAGSP